MKTVYKDKEVFIKESTSDMPIVCKIRKILLEGGTAFYEVESGDDTFHIAIESVQWIKQRKDVKIVDIDRVNFAPMRILSNGH